MIGDGLATAGGLEAAKGYYASNGRPYSAKSIRAMLAQRARP